jgi:hypothetical protein
MLAGCGLLVALWLHLQTRFAKADDVPTDDSPVPIEGILVMRTGAVVAGKIIRSGNSYEVKGPYGQMQVPAELVKLRCADIHEAYTKLRETAKSRHSANAQTTLARWCLTHQLDDEARQELHEALLLEPDREDTKRLLRDAEDAIKAHQKNAAAREPVSTARPARPASATDDQMVTLGGLSREQALQFTRRIQPLLVNSCAAAGCHSRNSQTGFRLQNVSPGRNANRNATERNLAQILERVDVKKPKTSLLLTTPRRKHGRNGRPLFAGQRGDEQFAELEKWVTAVARDAIQRCQHDSWRKDSAQRAAAYSQNESEAAANAHSASAAGLRVSNPDPFAQTGSNPTSSQLPLPPVSGDPFDPVAFNRATGRARR